MWDRTRAAQKMTETDPERDGEPEGGSGNVTMATSLS
jgi:hypothetical protein